MTRNAIPRRTWLGAALIEPHAEGYAVDQGFFDMVAPSFNILGWFARREWLDANADLARRLAAVFYDTARWVNTHPDESAAIEAKYTQIDPAVTRTMARKPLATALRTAEIQPVPDLATRYALLDRPWRAADLIAPGFG